MGVSMGAGFKRTVLPPINRLFRTGTAVGFSDAQLLERFLQGHDEGAESAFNVLVERHGPMVLAVCGRVLNDPHDAQDAFQATFLILVQKAGAIRKRESVADWLHGVARRVSAAHEPTWPAADRSSETSSREHRSRASRRNPRLMSGTRSSTCHAISARRLSSVTFKA